MARAYANEKEKVFGFSDSLTQPALSLRHGGSCSGELADPLVQGYLGSLGPVLRAGLLEGEQVRVEPGKLTQIGDTSGHYWPDSRMFYQVMRRLELAGVEPDGVDVKMIGKNKGERALIASATEFMNYGGDAQAEQKMRRRRERLREDLQEEIAAREARRARGKTLVTNVNRERSEYMVNKDLVPTPPEVRVLYGLPAPSAPEPATEATAPGIEPVPHTSPYRAEGQGPELNEWGGPVGGHALDGLQDDAQAAGQTGSAERRRRTIDLFSGFAG